jgi:hypothetical protein
MKRITAVENPQSEPLLSQDPQPKTQSPGTEFWDPETGRKITTQASGDLQRQMKSRKSLHKAPE